MFTVNSVGREEAEQSQFHMTIARSIIGNLILSTYQENNRANSRNRYFKYNLINADSQNLRCHLVIQSLL